MTLDNGHSPQKNIFVILGVARSGTSVITRALKALGIELGTKLTLPGKWNPTGFWEDNDIVYKINQHLFNKLHFRWDSVKLLEDDYLTNPVVQTLQQSAAHLLRQRLENNNQWGFKDPRTARILPFWQSIFSSLELNEQYIIALRNPLCSAHSLEDLGLKDIEKGLLLWLMHLIPAIEQTHGKKRIVVSYEKMLQNPDKELTRLQKHFTLPPISKNELNQFTQAFLNKHLDHYHYTAADLVSHPAVKMFPLILRCYNCLLALAEDKITFQDDVFIATWAEIKEEFQLNYPQYCYIDKLLTENTQLQKNLRSMQRSPSWKMMYPFRMIEKTISFIRKQIKLRYSLMANKYE